MSSSAVPFLLDQLDRLRASLATRTCIGFPAARDIDYSPLAPFFTMLLNHVGDPESDPGTVHVKAWEREVLRWFTDLFLAPPDDRWGYLTSGGTESNHYALYLARSRWPNGLLYRSASAHYSVSKIADMLGLQEVVIRSDDDGEIDYDDLHNELSRRRDRPAIIVANVGTTMTEAVDDPATIRRILAELAMSKHHLHVDAALAGVPLALLQDRPVALDLSRGCDTLSVTDLEWPGSSDVVCVTAWGWGRSMG